MSTPRSKFPNQHSGSWMCEGPTRASRSTWRVPVNQLMHMLYNGHPSVGVAIREPQPPACHRFVSPPSPRSSSSSRVLLKRAKIFGPTVMVVPTKAERAQNTAAYVNLSSEADTSAGLSAHDTSLKIIEEDSPPQMTGPKLCKIAVHDHSIPRRIPNSLVGLMVAQLAATNVIQAPLANP